MSYETLLVEESQGLLKIRLNRPESYNAINTKMIEELHEAFLGAERNRSLRAVLLTGQGKAFCSGGDVKNFFTAFQTQVAESLFHHMPTRLHDMMLTMKQLDKPILGAINGPAVGAGFSIAAACDLLVATESAYFSLAYLKIGLSPDGGSTYFLPRSLGTHKTYELLCFGDRLSAQDAKGLGLVAQVFPDASFQEESMKVLKRLGDLPTRAAAVGKKLIFESFNHSIETQLNRETQGVKQTAFGKDFFEGVSSFVQKKSPEFTGE